ncbi:hypothetical protein [Gordonibacter massiliensis (ex Traore et al. 2017)]|uniref:hypothetical protein n=1 Tax=Gordonibacter massiliensis (ex Traore et al. 2017) TaxID=1841863 RepID=UPI001C8CBA7A|nr:hypothetical protein [Gordonibacter massiliensis (ex Traore et al. 2017)]MBX9033810.1 hypothetical protein [Gordonibacter massiliensis (ex Traore et al. 2017)]
MRSLPACNVADTAAAARAHGMSLSLLVERTMQAAGRRSVQRLYVGSNLCSQYFLRQPEQVWREAFSLCRRERIPATLVVPVFSQKDLAEARRRIDEVVSAHGDAIDEITVNDVGMVTYCLDRYGLPLNAGRLFSKEPRDPRYVELFEAKHAVGVPALVTELFRRGELQGLELDPTHAALDLSELRGYMPHLEVGVHMPYCYLSTGSICELAGIGRPVREKFRPNAACTLECTRCAIGYRLPYGARLLKFGRAVYFPNHDCTVCEGEDFRMIVSPFDVLVPRRDARIEHGPTAVRFQADEPVRAGRCASLAAEGGAR